MDISNFYYLLSMSESTGPDGRTACTPHLYVYLKGSQEKGRAQEIRNFYMNEIVSRSDGKNAATVLHSTISNEFSTRLKQHWRICDYTDPHDIRTILGTLMEEAQSRIHPITRELQHQFQIPIRLARGSSNLFRKDASGLYQPSDALLGALDRCGVNKDNYFYFKPFHSVIESHNTSQVMDETTRGRIPTPVRELFKVTVEELRDTERLAEIRQPSLFPPPPPVAPATAEPPASPLRLSPPAAPPAPLPTCEWRLHFFLEHGMMRARLTAQVESGDPAYVDIRKQFTNEISEDAIRRMSTGDHAPDAAHIELLTPPLMMTGKYTDKSVPSALLKIRMHGDFARDVKLSVDPEILPAITAVNGTDYQKHPFAQEDFFKLLHHLGVRVEDVERMQLADSISGEAMETLHTAYKDQAPDQPVTEETRMRNRLARLLESRQGGGMSLVGAPTTRVWPPVGSTPGDS